jgi:hypothetical protein
MNITDSLKKKKEQRKKKKKKAYNQQCPRVQVVEPDLWNPTSLPYHALDDLADIYPEPKKFVFFSNEHDVK